MPVFTESRTILTSPMTRDGRPPEKATRTMVSFQIARDLLPRHGGLPDSTQRSAEACCTFHRCFWDCDKRLRNSFEPVVIWGNGSKYFVVNGSPSCIGISIHYKRSLDDSTL